MKNTLLYLIALLAFSFTSPAQEYKRSYLDSTFASTEEGKHTYFREIAKDSMKNWYRLKTFYKSGKIREDVRCSTAEGGFLDGPRLEYWENGNLKEKAVFVDRREMGTKQTWYENGKPQCVGRWEDSSENGSRHDFLIVEYWDENGRQTIANSKGRYIKTDKTLHEEGEIDKGVRVGKWTGRHLRYGLSFEEQYEKGALVSGKSTDASNNKYDYSKIDEQPKFQNGASAISQYILANLKRPKGPAQSGRMMVMFKIAASGKIKDVRIKRSVEKNIDEEAVRVLSKMPDWEPGRHRGMPIEKAMMIPIQI